MTDTDTDSAVLVDRDSAEQRRDKAQQALDELKGKVARGEKVSGADMSHAEAELEVAQMAVDAAADQEADAAEARRQERIETLCAQVNAPPNAQAIVAAFDRATEALADLRNLAQRDQAQRNAAQGELRSLDRRIYRDIKPFGGRDLHVRLVAETALRTLLNGGDAPLRSLENLREVAGRNQYASERLRQIASKETA